MRKLFVAGNWKMNTTLESGRELAAGLVEQLADGPVDQALAVEPGDGLALFAQLQFILQPPQPVVTPVDPQAMPQCRVGAFAKTQAVLGQRKIVVDLDIVLFVWRIGAFVRRLGYTLTVRSALNETIGGFRETATTRRRDTRIAIA